MYSYEKTINTISSAVDTDEVDTIVEHFIESISVLYTRKEIISELYSHIESELGKKNYERNNKMKRALDLIESHIPKEQED